MKLGLALVKVNFGDWFQFSCLTNFILLDSFPKGIIILFNVLLNF